ncbi:MAG: aminotransferase class V-fold PLP-dependent enzyme [Qipengyuania sp.]|nr:aminotransferase class V-fold PLP-dependent enzyme [Qipengyuania sp.]
MTGAARTSRRGFAAGVAGLPLLASASPALAGGAANRSLGVDPDLIYLNTASAGPTWPAVLDTTIAAWRRLETNPVAMAYGTVPGSVSVTADAVRGLVAGTIGCTADEVLLTRSTTDAMTTAALGLRLVPGDRVLTTDQEHAGGEVGWQYRARRDGIAVDQVSILPGAADADAVVRDFAAKIRPETRVISVSHVLSQTGLRMPVAAIAALARSRGVLCIVDGAQAVGAMPVDVAALGCDAYAASGHKWLMAPKGTGFLYIARHAQDRIQPVAWELTRSFAGNSSGLDALPNAIGLGRAIELLAETGPANVEAHNLGLRDRMWATLSRMPGLRMASPPPGKLATALIAVELPAAIDSLAMRKALLERHRIVVKMVDKRRFNGIRFSPHVFNDEAQVDRALSAFRSELSKPA